ncbi:putative holin [Erwinia phage Panisse]|uniref:Holin n=1 Tax=Erwinia phage Harbringer TaxID=3158978 RepID=A0AAU8EHD6_9CAUD|nr:putative holin [Erwinia phage Panisse]
MKHRYTNNKWKKQFRRTFANLLVSAGCDGKTAKKLAKGEMEAVTDSYHGMSFNMYRREWRLYDPKDTAVENWSYWEE